MQVSGNDPIANCVGISHVVDIEQLGRQGKTSIVSLTFFGDYLHMHVAILLAGCTVSDLVVEVPKI